MNWSDSLPSTVLATRMPKSRVYAALRELKPGLFEAIGSRVGSPGRQTGPRARRVLVPEVSFTWKAGAPRLQIWAQPSLMKARSGSSRRPGPRRCRISCRNDELLGQHAAAVGDRAQTHLLEGGVFRTVVECECLLLRWKTHYDVEA